MLSPEDYVERYGGKSAFLKKVATELALTLSSRAEPYYDVDELARQFAEDTNIHPRAAAMAFGYPHFDQFLKSDLVKSHVRMLTDANGKVMFLPVIDERSRHIRDDQAISRGAAVHKENKNEQRKIALAMLPENKACLLEGKRRLVDIAHELLKDGRKAISYQEMQSKYEELYNVPLAGEELRRLFQRRHVNRIFTTLMNEEFELFTSPERPGQIFMNLRAPRDVLFAKFDEYEKEQENFQNRKKENSYGNLPDRRRHGPKRPPIDINALKPILPPIQVGDDDFNEESVFGPDINTKPCLTDKFVFVESVDSKADNAKINGSNDNNTVALQNSSSKASKNCANNTFNRLWNAVESRKPSRGHDDQLSSDEDQPVRLFGKNVPGLVDSSKPQQWTRRAQDGIFTSDEDDDSEKGEKTLSITQKKVSKMPINTNFMKPKISSPVKIQRVSTSGRNFSAEYDSDEDNKRDIRIKSHLATRSRNTRNHSTFSDIDDVEDPFEDENLRATDSSLLGDVIYPQPTRGTLSKPLPTPRNGRSLSGSVFTNGENDSVFSPYSTMAADENAEVSVFDDSASRRMPPSAYVESRQPVVGRYGTRDRSANQRDSVTTMGGFTSAYSTLGSGLSSTSHSITAGRSGFESQTQMAMTSFEFLKYKHQERIRYLSIFISSVVLYRSPEAIEYQMLVEALEKLDHNYEMVLNGMSLIEFIEKNCVSVAILVHNDSIVFGWHLSKASSNIADVESELTPLRSYNRC